MARLLTRTRTRLAVKRTANKQKGRFETKPATQVAGVIANGLAVVDGQLYGTGAEATGAIDVINMGRAAAAIYVPQNGSGTVTLASGSGACGGGSGTGIGQHYLDGPEHLGELAQSQAPWAATDADLQAHIADEIHHERLHDIVNTDDHQVTASRYSVLGTPNAANTLGMWLTDEDGTAGNVLLRSDDDGNARLNALFAHNRVQSESFGAGYGGNGYRLDYGVTNAGRASLELDDLSVRGRMTVRELLIRRIRTSNGDIFVSSGGEVESVVDDGGGYWTLTFKEAHGMLEDDLVRAQAWTGNGIYQIDATVTAVQDTLHATIYVNSGDDPDTALASGNSLGFARHGSTSDPDRQGVIYLTSDDPGGPFIRVVDGVDSWADWGTPATLKVQMGRLDGITDATLGTLSGYGLYGQNVYLTGIMAAGGGDAVLGDEGLNIQAGTSSDGGWSNHSDKVTFAEDPMANLDDGNVIGQIGANRFVSGSDVVRRLATRVNAGAESSTDQARIGLEAYWINAEADVPIQSAEIQMIGEEGAPSINISVQGATANAGTITLGAPTVNVAGDIAMTGGGNIGTALSPVGKLYADELVVGTTYTNNTGFVNDIRYYPRTELNTYLDNTFAGINHQHDGFITSAELTDELADYATTAYVDAEIADIPAPDLSNYWTKAQADGRYTLGTTYTAHAAAANPHGTALADLTARAYGDLTARGHVLADAAGLGEDHTVSGLTIGHVLRATGTTAARFMQLGATDLGITAARYAVLGTPSAANQIGIWYPTSDGSAGYGLLITDANGAITVADLAADDVAAATVTTSGAIAAGDTVTVDGAIRSLDYVAGTAGYYLADANGKSEIGNLHTRGTFSAAVFEADSTAVFANRQLVVKSSGTLAAALTIDNSGGTQYSVAVEYTARDKFKPFAAGDILEIRGLATYTTPTSAGNSAIPAWEFWTPSPLATGSRTAAVWLEVSADPTDSGSAWIYSCEWKAGNDKVTFARGEGIADHGQAGDGAILTVATGGHAPYIDLRTHSGSPWEDQETHVRLGQIGGLAAVAAAESEWGFVAGTLGTGSRYLVMTDQQTKLHGVPMEMTDRYNNITGAWDTNGIAILAPINLQWADLGEEEAIGGGGPDEDWYTPTYSALNWTADPGDEDAAEYGAVRMSTRRAVSGGFGEEGHQSTIRLELSSAGRALVDGDSVIAETGIVAQGLGDDTRAAITARAYDYSRSSGTEIEIDADTVRISANQTYITALILSSLKLTNFPTSEANVAIGQVYVDAGTLKVKTT